MTTGFDSNNDHYIHQTTYTQRERIVGLFIFLGFILFLFFVFISVKNEHLFEKRVPFYISVKSSEGISQGTVVKTLGTELGRVSELRLSKDGHIHVTIEVYKRRQVLIREGARALVNRLGGIGSALIEINSDSIDAPMLAAGSTIPVDETASLNDLILSVANLIQAADSQKLLGKVDTILPRLEQTLGNVHEIIKQIASGHGTLGAAVFDKNVEQDLKVVVKSGAHILSEAQGIISIAKERLQQLEPILKDTDVILKDAQGATQSLPELVQELHEIIAQANTALTLINAELNEIPGTTVDVKRALTKTDDLLDSVQDTWPLSTHSKKAKKQLIPAHSNHD